MRSSVVIVEDEVLPTRGMARFLDHRVVRERPPNIIFTGHHPTDGVRSRQSWLLDRGLSSSTIRGFIVAPAVSPLSNASLIATLPWWPPNWSSPGKLACGTY
jgi:hypothetical protein